MLEAEVISGLNEVEGVQLICLHNHFQAILRHLNWWAFAKTKWISDRDHNTRYYHNIVASHRRQNHILSVRINDSMIIQPKEIMAKFVQLYFDMSNQAPSILSTNLCWPFSLGREGLDYNCLVKPF